MTSSNSHFVEDKIISQYIHLLYKKSIIASYDKKPLRRDLFSSYKLDFKSFIGYLKGNKNSITLISTLSDISNENTPNFERFFEDNGSFYSRNKIALTFLRQKSKSSLENLKINSTPSFRSLNDKYKVAIVSSEKDIEQINWDYLLVFKTFFGNVELSELIELYIDIVIDEKEFDGIEIIEDLLFNENYEPKYYFLQRSLFIYEKVLKCYAYTDKKLLIKSILDKLYQFMDENFDTNNNPIPHPNVPSEFSYFHYDGGDKGVIQKKDRDTYSNSFTINIPKLSFLNLTQINNAYRLNLINEVSYNRSTIRLQKSKNLTDDIEMKIKNFDFLILDSDIDIPEQHNPDDYFQYPNTADFHELNSSQKSEYKTAFSGRGNLHKVKKYLKFRTEKIWVAFYKNQITSENAIDELQFLRPFASIYSKDLVGEITAYNSLKKNNLLDKIELCRKKIKDKAAIQNEGLCLKFNEVYYRYYIALEYTEAAKLPEGILDLIIKGGNISEEEWWKWNEENQNSEVSSQASRLNDKIRHGEYRGLVSSKKTDAPKLINLLEKEYNEFMFFFKENLSPNQHSHFIDPLISRLMSAYFTMKEYQKAISLSDEFLAIKNEYKQLYLTSDAEDIFRKKEKCLQKSDSDYLSYEDAKVFIYSIKLSSESQWREFKRLGRKPENIPSSPEKVYKDKGWKGFQDWLGYETVNNNSYHFLAFEEAKIFVETLKLKSENEWKAYKKLGKKPDNIPALPERVYNGKGWKGFQDWLGYEVIKRNSNNFLSYEEAKVFIHSLELSSENEWREFKRLGVKPENIPSKPETVYKGKGWKGFKDWLGY